MTTPKSTVGFPSPAENYSENFLSLDEHLVEHREATFYMRADGDAMTAFGIRAGDLLIVDRAITPVDQQIVMAVLNSDFIVRQYCPTPKGIVLKSGSEDVPEILVTTEMDFSVWGVVRWSIHAL